MYYSHSAQLTAKRDPTYIQLSLEQKQVYDLVVFERKSVFFTGQAGSGKSFLLRAIIQGLQRLLLPEQLAVTALTGIAAVNIAGQTLHSLFASPLNFESNDPEINVQNHLKMSLMRPPLRERLNALHTILIDEVSMLQGTVFDTLDLLFRKIKRTSTFFGGIQLVLCGDFMQLPPIQKQRRPILLFESKNFDKILSVKLTVQFRQQDDKLINMLNKIRNGQVDQEVKSLLYQCLKTEFDINKQEESQLRTTYNQFHLNIQNLQKFVKDSQENKKVNFFRKVSLLRQTKMAEIEIQNAKYVPPVFPIRLYSYKKQVEEFNSSRLLAQKRQIITVNSLDEGITDKIEKPEASISLAIGAQIMLTKNLDVTAGLCNGSVGIVVNIKAKTDSVNLNAQLDDVEVFVKFGQNVVSIKAFEMEQIGSNGRDRVGLRKQLPLQLSYAISIHKSQGLTLDSAVMDLKSCFENGQVYVALSRIRSLEGLILTGINFEKIKADESSMKFCNEVKSITELKLFSEGKNLIDSEIIEENIIWGEYNDDITRKIDLRLKSPQIINKEANSQIIIDQVQLNKQVQQQIQQSANQPSIFTSSNQVSPNQNFPQKQTQFHVQQIPQDEYVAQKQYQQKSQISPTKRPKLTIKSKTQQPVFVKAAEIVDISDSNTFLEDEPIQKTQPVGNSPQNSQPITKDSQPVSATPKLPPITPIKESTLNTHPTNFLELADSLPKQPSPKPVSKPYYDFEFYEKFL